jgi:prepilin-type N-terminal cleavage/methylation domain-containing protein
MVLTLAKPSSKNCLIVKKIFCILGMASVYAKINNMHKRLRAHLGFTIVELLVVIVVIGILATLTIVSFTGVSSQATVATLQSDLKNASTQLGLNKIANSQELYPSDLASANGGNGINASPNVTYSYKYNALQNSYCISATSSTVNITYFITSDNTAPREGICPMESGAVAWGSGGNEYGMSLAQASDEGYAIYGYTTSYGAGDNDALLIKYGSSGLASWARTWGGVSYDRGYSVVGTDDGGYITTGETYSYGFGISDMFLAKYDSTGTLSWDRTWGGTGFDVGNSIIQTSDGGYAVTGNTDSYGAGGYDMFLAKYDSTGTLSWSRTWGGPGTEYGISLMQTADGGYIIAGHTTSYGSGSYDIFLAKYDSSGTLSWNRTWGGSNIDTIKSVVQTTDGGYAVTGRTQSYGAGSNDAIFT